MKKIWSYEKDRRKIFFRDDYRRRAKLFDALVYSVALYDVEIWR